MYNLKEQKTVFSVKMAQKTVTGLTDRHQLDRQTEVEIKLVQSSVFFVCAAEA